MGFFQDFADNWNSIKEKNMGIVKPSEGIRDEFLTDIVKFYEDGTEPSKASQDMRYYLHQHEKRLAEKGVKISRRYLMDEKSLKHTTTKNRPPYSVDLSFVECDSSTQFTNTSTQKIMKKHKNSASIFYVNILNREDQMNAEYICPNCGHKNEAAALFCNHCGKAFTADENDADSGNVNDDERQGFNGSDRTAPFGFGGVFTAFDPLAGMKPEDEIADGVKVSEAAKYVGRTTQYFMMVFKKIRDGIGSRFNFSAAIFSEIYFLYRKMTVLGVIISVFMIATSVLSTAIMMSPDWIANYNNALQLMESGVSVNPFSKQLEFMYLPLALQGIRLVVRIICGACANRLYYNHCMKQIGKIKAEVNASEVNKTLEQKGGVNLPLAACFYAASVIIGYISSYISQTWI